MFPLMLSGCANDNDERSRKQSRCRSPVTLDRILPVGRPRVTLSGEPHDAATV
jgi:hypothetical protein